MSLEESLKACQKYFLDLTWAHWNRLGGTGFGATNHCSVDPEALLLLTVLIGKEEGRLLEIMAEWLHRYGHLISIERIKTLFKICEKNSFAVEKKEAKNILHKAKLDLLKIASGSISKTQYNKWKKIYPTIRQLSSLSDISSKKLKEPNVVVKQNLLLRLRYLFGPGTRADILYFALTITHQEKNPFRLEISPPIVSRCLGYNMSSAHRTLNDFADALILKKEAVDGKKTSFIFHHSIFENLKITEKCFINWFPIVQMAFFLQQFHASLAGQPQKYDESIVKSYYLRFLSFCQDMARQSYIPIKLQGAVDLPLKDVPPEHILKMGPLLLEEILDFVTSAQYSTRSSKKQPAHTATS